VSAGIATLQTILTENVVEKVNAKAQAFFEEVGTIAASASGDLFANSFGSMATLFFQAGPVKNFQDAVRSDTERFVEFFGKMLDQGIYLAPSQFEAMFLSQAHSDADLEETLQALKAALCG
jgi:glutamate-1-semialdehyde 2,1-aminomutase